MVRPIVENVKVVINVKAPANACITAMLAFLNSHSDGHSLLCACFLFMMQAGSREGLTS
jgi:hypothetical protein